MTPHAPPRPTRDSLRVPLLPLLIGITVLAYFVLYAPQPLLPTFQRQFGVSTAQTALLISATMLPLSIAPLLYGSLLGRLAPLRLLQGALLLLAASELAFTLADQFVLLVAIRFVQGLLLPAVFTAITTQIASTAPPQHLRRTMAIYVAATITGGYFGRLLSGVAATFSDWRIFSGGLAVGLLLCALALLNSPLPTATGGQPTPQRAWLTVLQNRAYLHIYAAVFCLFFVFAGLLNFLPFHIDDLLQQPPEWITSLMYTGYLLGVGTSLGSGWIVARLGSDQRALLLGYGIFLLALGITTVPHIVVLFVALFLFCGAMFLVHAVAAGMINQLGTQPKGIVNALYVTFYYAGGVLGSYLPGFVFVSAGWAALIGTLAGVALVGILALLLRPTATPIN